MEHYQEIKLNKFREVVIFSFFFISFLSGGIIFTKEFCGFIRVAQEKIKIKYMAYDEWSYSNSIVTKYKWLTI